MADQRASNILPEYGISYKPYHEGLANPMPQHQVGNRFSGDDDDDVSDDPAWYNAPRGSLQPALSTAILKKHSASSMTSTETGASSNPASPHNEADGEDYFPPTQPQIQQRRSIQIPVPMRHSRSSKQRPSLQRRSPSTSLSSPITSPPSAGRASVSLDIRESVDFGRKSSAHGHRSAAAGRGSVSLDIRESLDYGGKNGAHGYRESMMRYRPSDLNTNDMKKNLMTRDSLATFTDPVELLSSSRTSVFSNSGGPRPSEDGLTDFLKAARTGNTMLMKASIQDSNTGFRQRDPVHGQSALHIAVRFGQFSIVKLLCQSKKTRKILLDSVDNRQNTPLHLAAAKSRRITKFLLEQGASVASVNSRNQTPLGVHILTCRRDEPLIAEMLLQHKSDPNALLDTSTLIHKAVDMSLYEIAYRLVRYGARLDIKDENDKMVFDKVNRKVLRQLFSKISYPPVWVPNDERKNCMLCSRKFNRFNIGIRRHHCRHCGRICCGQCSHVSVESDKFPKTFEEEDGRTSKKLQLGEGAKMKRVCKTCSIVFKERETPQEEKTWSDEFVEKVVGYTWEEIEEQPGSSRRSSVA
ncbi:Gpn-loop gtpase, partial [Globisporangium splendens]